ncbi:F-BAR and double SH3 domains protein 1 isoform X2 [Salmo salar]|uniref:F-BAR and double SH3 domains protein 1 isoform X2 n=1 Tax=Salmo salar TaxID=8030 RepID=A0A1S3SV27_SALSA|nr:F-BAR and double SH3 domains protein 1 isoform X2 [Salmo salar]|eukprot:XP_014068195.1 PREDICTED: F-BAR and double SH3 domains protein 1 isoform X1 [Salmo salar]
MLHLPRDALVCQKHSGSRLLGYNKKETLKNPKMQPPPRKVKETQQVKMAFAEQVGRLQSKQQQEVELLEDIRSFSKQRAAIEQEYSQALQRLAVQFQRKDWQRGKGDSLNSGSVFAVWRSLIEATAQSGVCRLTAADGYRSLTADALKSLRAAKELKAKRGLEQLQRVQGEVVDALRELHKVKKRYYQLSHMANVAREKAADAQAKFKKSDHGIFHFRTGLQKMSSKLNTRLRECDQRLTEVRNEYLLTLSAINSHHQYYYTAELPAIMRRLDSDLYEQIREHFILLCCTEIDTCRSTHSNFSKICENSTKVSREQNIQIFLQEFPVFTRTASFHFQVAPKDKVCILKQHSSSAEGESCLDKEARKWSAKAAKDYKIISHGDRALQMLDRRFKLLSGDTGVSVEQKMVEVKESVRKAQVSRVKAESRLALLASAGVDVEPWVSSAMTQADEELERDRRLSEARMSNGDISEDEFEFTDFDDYDEDGDTFIDSTSCSVPCGYPLACMVLYSYQACQGDELSITEGEELQVIEDGDMEDWLKARNAAGQVGYVPERYLQFLWSPGEGSSVCLAQGFPCPQLDWSFNSSGSSSEHSKRQQGRSPQSGGLARALYEYQGQGPEELSFPEGAVIRLLRCRQGEVDDGFWEGELDGRVGVFPSLVVELLGDGEEEEEEESLPTPTLPPFSPPIPISGTPCSLLCFSSGPGSWSVNSTPPKDQEDRLQASFSLKTQSLSDSRAESGGSTHSSPDLSARRIRPTRAPPLPPTQRHSPMP